MKVMMYYFLIQRTALIFTMMLGLPGTIGFCGDLPKGLPTFKESVAEKEGFFQRLLGSEFEDKLDWEKGECPVSRWLYFDAPYKSKVLSAYNADTDKTALKSDGNFSGLICGVRDMYSKADHLSCDVFILKDSDCSITDSALSIGAIYSVQINEQISIIISLLYVLRDNSHGASITPLGGRYSFSFEDLSMIFKNQSVCPVYIVERQVRDRFMSGAKLSVNLKDEVEQLGKILRDSPAVSSLLEEWEFLLGSKGIKELSEELSKDYHASRCRLIAVIAYSDSAGRTPSKCSSDMEAIISDIRLTKEDK